MVGGRPRIKQALRWEVPMKLLGRPETQGLLKQLLPKTVNFFENFGPTKLSLLNTQVWYNPTAPGTKNSPIKSGRRCIVCQSVRRFEGLLDFLIREETLPENAVILTPSIEN